MMKLAIMQPYFFPYIGYFQLMQAVDRFILLNDVQYIRHGWINRNRILKPNTGVQYIIAPLAKHGQQSKISEIQVAQTSDWKQKIVRQLEHYRKKAPFFKPVLDFVQTTFQYDALHMATLNEHYLKNICQFIGVPTNVVSSESLQLDYTNIKDKDDWALTICNQLGASVYINPIGGKELFVKEKFQQHNIQLHFLQLNDIKYSQRREVFESHLSIIDVMMFNEPKAIQQMLQQYSLV